MCGALALGFSSAPSAPKSSAAAAQAARCAADASYPAPTRSESYSHPAMSNCALIGLSLGIAERPAAINACALPTS